MSQIKTFDKQNLKALRFAIQSDLDKIGKEYGLSLQMGNVRFQSTEFRTQVTAKVLSAEPEKEIDYSEKYPWMELPKLGATFQNAGETFVVVKHMVNRPKYPVVAKKVLTGQMYKFPASVSKRIV